MGKGHVRLLIVDITLIAILAIHIIFRIFHIDSFVLFLMLAAISSFYYLGYEKNNHRYRKDILLTTFIYSISYLVITNLLGIVVGFNKTGYSLKVGDILQNIIPIISVIVLSELLRYMIISKTSKYKLGYILSVLLFIMIDISLKLNIYNLQSTYGIMRFINLILLSSITKNITLTYLAAKIGYKPGIAYRFFFELPAYFLPIFPDFGIYIQAVIDVIFPMFFLYVVYRNFEKVKNRQLKNFRSNKKIKAIINAIIIIMALIVIALSSGFFRYYTLTIGSGSMEKAINKGDIIIVKKLNRTEIENLKEEQVLVFHHSNQIIVHRIIRVLKTQNQIYFYTKGDNNQAEDGYPIDPKDVIGITEFKIPYIGYPTVWINELL